MPQKPSPGTDLWLATAKKILSSRNTENGTRYISVGYGILGVPATIVAGEASRGEEQGSNYKQAILTFGMEFSH